MPYTLESDVQIRPSQKMPNDWERRAFGKETPNLDDKPLPETKNMNPENKLPVFGTILHSKPEAVSEKYYVHGFPGALVPCFIPLTGDKGDIVTMNPMAGNGSKWGIQPILHVLRL